MMSFSKCVISVFFSYFIISQSYAAKPYSLTIKGNLKIEPPECILNTGTQEIIGFGDVLLPRLDGNNYKQPVPLNLTCKNLYRNNLTMSIVGDPTSFNSNGGLKTTNNKLGIYFYINKERRAINTPVRFDYKQLPTLEAAPIKNNTASFIDTDGGDFSATATLKVEYE